MSKYVKVTMYDKPTVDLDIFIVPNKAAKVCERKYVEDGFYGRIEAVFNKNNYPMNLNDWLVQLWFTGSGCGNWEDHDPLTYINGEEYHVRFASYDIPYDLCKGWREGETVTLYMPVELISTGDQSKIKRQVWALRLTPRQKEYRYKMAGDFESARCKVIW